MSAALPEHRPAELASNRPSSVRARLAGSPAVRPALVVPRLLFGALADIRTIAESTRAIPELAEQLATIQARVSSLDEEVVRMRRAVETIGGDVVGVRESTEPLAGHLDGVRQSIAPLQRLARFGRRPGGRAGPPG